MNNQPIPFSIKAIFIVGYIALMLLGVYALMRAVVG